MYHGDVVLERVLTGVVEVINNAGGPEDLVVVVEALESSFDSLKTLCIVNVTTDKITELNKVAHSVDNLCRDMALDSR